MVPNWRVAAIADPAKMLMLRICRPAQSLRTRLMLDLEIPGINDVIVGELAERYDKAPSANEPAMTLGS
jgi:hypothetical protein